MLRHLWLDQSETVTEFLERTGNMSVCGTLSLPNYRPGARVVCLEERGGKYFFLQAYFVY